MGPSGLLRSSTCCGRSGDPEPPGADPEEYEECSAGFANLYGESDPQNIYAVTAGHCGHTNSAWFQGQGDQSSNGPAIGTIRTNSEYDVSGAISNCDCASIGPLPAGKATAGVFVNNNATYYFKRVAFENDYFAGKDVSRFNAVRSRASPLSWRRIPGIPVRRGT